MKIERKLIVILCYLIFFTLCLLSTSSYSKPNPYVSLEKWTAQQLKNYHIPGASIAIIKDYKIVWSGGIGYANLKQQWKVKRNTLFRIGSVTKSLSAYAALMAVNAGLIKLNQPIAKWIAKSNIPSALKKKLGNLTIHQLLTHTSGLTDNVILGYVYGQKTPSLLQSILGQAPAQEGPLKFIDKPGKHFHYSNSGYALLELILENIYQESFPNIIYNLVTNPLHMYNTSYSFILPRSLVNTPYFATPYNDYESPVVAGARIAIRQGATGLWSTSTDLARFVIAIQEGLKQREPIDVMMVKPQITIKKNIAASIGFDTILLKKKYTSNHYGQYFLKTGAEFGFTAVIIGSFEHGNGAVILLNSCTDHHIGPLPKPKGATQGCLILKPNAIGLRSKLIQKIAAIESW